MVQTHILGWKCQKIPDLQCNGTNLEGYDLLLEKQRFLGVKFDYGGECSPCPRPPGPTSLNFPGMQSCKKFLVWLHKYPVIKINYDTMLWFAFMDVIILVSKKKTDLGLVKSQVATWDLTATIGDSMYLLTATIDW